MQRLCRKWAKKEKSGNILDKLSHLMTPLQTKLSALIGTNTTHIKQVHQTYFGIHVVGRLHGLTRFPHGFTRAAQGLINIAFGPVDINSILPHRQTIYNRAKEQAKKEKGSLIQQIKNVMENGIGITTDMWTDSFKRSHTVLTCHFFTEDWKQLSDFYVSI